MGQQIQKEIIGDGGKFQILYDKTGSTHFRLQCHLFEQTHIIVGHEYLYVQKACQIKNIKGKYNKAGFVILIRHQE